MKQNKQIILSLFFCLILISSCSSNVDEGYYKEWKSLNESYFANMKDSTGYVLYNIPVSSGGGSFYYNVISHGDSTSASPLNNDIVTVNYRGKIINGTVFDQTFSGVNPLADSIASPRSFYLKGLISGWIVNLTQMKVGERRKIILPQELGYGPYGSGSLILPYSTTVWDIQLIKIGN